MSLKYKEFSGLHLPSIEQEILAKWQQENAFEKSVSLRDGATPFVFYEGPPSANGMPGIHHVISRTLKDLVCRYKTMQGFQVKRKGGWDTHGLPVELGVEKELGITKEDIGTKISVEEYNAKCREAVLRFKNQWDDITRKMGYWVDLNNPYITFENGYIETLWYLLQRLYKKNLLYKSVSIQPYSPAAGTGLSSHELNQPGTYKDVKDTSATVLFEVSDTKALQIENHNAPVYFMAWTTTPWTLPSNLGLTVGANIEYSVVNTFNPYTHQAQTVILATALLVKYFKAEAKNADFEAYTKESKLIPWKVLKTFTGKELEGIRYNQLIPLPANAVEKIKEITPDADPFKIVIGDFVTTEDGTGIVHTAPAFGADDFKVGKQNNLGILTLVDREGKFIDDMGEYTHRYVKNYKDDANYVDVNVDIAVALKLEGKAFKVEKYEHNYPHCWRTDKPILYYPLDAWFIKTTAVKDRLVELNKTINWKPKSTGEGRFGNWLENLVDWNLSRSRFWGTPLPIWQTEDGEEQICIGSVKELMQEIQKAGDLNSEAIQNSETELDLHKPYVDKIVLKSASGKPMHRVPDLIDVWFDSGAMPYAQWGLDYEKLEKGDPKPFKYPFDSSFPADFIAEGVDQTRGWFYTLHAIAGLLFDEVAYKTVVSNGLVLDKNGNKMSKRLGNVVDPFETIEKLGADATRWYLITNASPWDNLKFDIEGIKEVQRKFFGTLYNTYQFFVLYANIDGFSFKEASIPVTERPELDRWILSALNSLIKNVTDAMNEYEPTQAGRYIEDFVDEYLSNWYVRLSRRRFWKGDYEQDKISAYQTLYECLETITRLIAPIAPFFSDAIFQNLNAVTNFHNVASVHHVLYPSVNESVINEELEQRMQLAQDASSLILSLRKKVNIKVRQPLQKVLIPVLNEKMKEQINQVADIIRSEVNIKEIEFLSADNEFIHKKLKPNFAALGKKLGAKMKQVAALLSAFDQQQIAALEQSGSIQVEADGESITVGVEEVEIVSEDIPGWTVASKGALTVALDITITEALQQEGDAREIVNRIQKIRKDSNFDVTDKVNIIFDTDNQALISSIQNFNEYICAEVLAESIEFSTLDANAIALEINGLEINTIVTKK